MKRGSIIEKILDALQEGTETTLNLLDIYTSGYSESYRKMRLQIRYGERRRFSKRWADMYQEMNKFYSLLSKLKKEGLVEKDKKSDSVIWRITKKGALKLKWLREANKFSSKKVDYQKQADTNFKVVSFDVPEKERHKRSWLRAVLSVLGFSMVQQSLWMGKFRIPEKFVKDLEERKMLEYVNIFEVTKRGTIKEIT